MENKAQRIPEVPPESIRLSTLGERWLSLTGMPLEEAVRLQRENAQPETEPDPLDLWESSLASSPSTLSPD